MTPFPGTTISADATTPEKIRAYMSRAETFKGGLPSDLLTLLGCPHRATPGGFKLVIPEVQVEHRESIGDALVVLLAHAATRLGIYSDDAPTLLSGLYASGAWKRCLLNESEAYDMAAVALCHLQAFVDEDGLDAFTQPTICRLLNEWLQPRVSWNKLPDVETAAALLFGDVWCALRDPARQSVYAGTMVHRERPPFLPGRCMVNRPADAVSLPDLGMMP